ncbi:MAG: nucleotide exchange factor GrpE [Candidatus Buchananbacteria bacterium RIFCSPHIGHO2_02_FULL_45_11b]|uniref:Protein GrpE n=4 Tax=Candidatus Buchananiibacteriota TaxID=1817903 RepID=A0A1G1YC45_9BACT|nr:MAG: nucleotide exchange factor GrpE [Candidatus Buchananbacteria bacterium RIFCSPHIGHO2_01_FULL_46_12]OGY49821.1 MAG: nucleotide exchange factor GrpE [Candidatus Buchananbacteria bacterium RIFCSPHIGHO2_02_FULL_45_11b]OGY54223.1 MAG: nucleotide exchange factor GrpE [Candidatus Buchananbacteria bacterium RIFCSPLOWO2_01_FULL_45_31]OGY57166.1 MAG: nucleotide exchange factor GrpE [Candidatus Buchananbacteria bacterium RIFCSPLOWO2_02_FULL_46_11b]
MDKQLEDLQDELALAQRKAEEHLDGWKRAKADYLNLKKDNEKFQTEIIQFANAGLIARLLPVFDNYKLALAHVPEDQKKAEWVSGFFHIKKQFEDFLKNLGIEEIKTLGQNFNPEFHEAAAHEEKEGFEPDAIFEEVKAGYLLQGKVIVPAKVKVAK